MNNQDIQVESAHLREFVVLAAEGNYRRAASRLNLSQASLTRHVDLLEAAIGVKLLNRDRHGIALTPAGAVFVTEARGLLDLEQRVIHLVQRIEQGADSYLKLGHIGVGEELLQAAVGTMAATRPDLKLVVSEHTIRAGLDNLTSGDTDLLITRPPIHDETIDETWLRDDPLVVALPHRHPTARQADIALDQLSADTLIMPAANEAPGAYAAIAGLCRKHQLSCDSMLAATDLPSLLVLVGAGCGYGLIPESAAHRHRDPAVRIMPIRDQQLSIPLHMAWRRDDTRPTLINLRRAILQAANRLELAPKPRPLH